MVRRRPRSAVLASVVAAALLAATPASAGERVDVTATDGVQLIGELDGASGPGVVLSHDEHGDRRGWQTLAATLAARGFRVLCVDLRGRGDSSGVHDLAAVDRDVEGAYRYLLGRKIRPVFLVGAGASGPASLLVATRVPVAGVVTIASPSMPDGRPTGADPHVPRLSLASATEVDALVGFLRDPTRGR